MPNSRWLLLLVEERCPGVWGQMLRRMRGQGRGAMWTGGSGLPRTRPLRSSRSSWIGYGEALLWLCSELRWEWVGTVLVRGIGWVGSQVGGSFLVCVADYVVLQHCHCLRTHMRAPAASRFMRMQRIHPPSNTSCRSPDLISCPPPPPAPLPLTGSKREWKVSNLRTEIDKIKSKEAQEGGLTPGQAATLVREGSLASHYAECCSCIALSRPT